MGAGRNDGFRDLIDFLVGGENHRSADAAVDQRLIPRCQLEGTYHAHLEGDHLAKVKILDCSPQVARQTGGICHIVFEVVQGHVIPRRAMNDAVVDLIFIAGRHLRKVNYLHSACKALIMDRPHAAKLETQPASPIWDPPVWFAA